MGCSGSKAVACDSAPPPAAAGKVLLSADVPAKARTAVQQADGSPTKGKGKGTGKGKGKTSGKGKGKGRSFREVMKSKFQVQLEGRWQDYEPEEDSVLKRAFLIGQPNTRFHLRGQSYEYSFETFTQRNLDSQKERRIRPPRGMTQPPAPLLPPGSVVFVLVPADAGASMELPDPNNPGQVLQVAVPPGAKSGARMAVPIPEKGEEVSAVVARQRGWTSGQRVVATAAAVGPLAVGGVVLGEHLSGGAVSDWAAGSPELGAAGDAIAEAVRDTTDWAEGAAADVSEVVPAAAGDATAWVEGAAADVADWAEGAATDVGEWAPAAAADAADWAEGAAEDLGDWAGDAAGDVADWAEDAFEDTGDFVMSLF